jgi:DinB family protein
MNFARPPSSRRISGRPADGEIASYTKPDIAQVAGDDAVGALVAQRRETVLLVESLQEDQVKGLTYAPGKWTLKEVLGHLADDERIFGYRALCIARGDTRPLPSFDEKAYVASAGFEGRPLASLLADYRAVRHATLAFLSGLTPEAWLRRGVVTDYTASVRGLAFHIAGHELRHLRALREKYLRPPTAHRPLG